MRIDGRKMRSTPASTSSCTWPKASLIGRQVSAGSRAALPGGSPGNLVARRRPRSPAARRTGPRTEVGQGASRPAGCRSARGARAEVPGRAARSPANARRGRAHCSKDDDGAARVPFAGVAEVDLVLLDEDLVHLAAVRAGLALEGLHFLVVAGVEAAEGGRPSAAPATSSAAPIAPETLA